jgi:hypothetical protein
MLQLPDILILVGPKKGMLGWQQEASSVDINSNKKK